MRWDADATQLATAPVPGTARPDRGPVLARILRELERGPSRREVADALPAIKDRHGRQDRRLGGAQGPPRPVGRGARRGAGRHRGAGQRRHVHAAERSAGAPSASPRSPPSPRRSLRRRALGGVRGRPLEARLATLREAAVDAAPGLGEPAARAEQALRALLAARTEEREAARKFGFLTVGGRVDLLSQTISRSVQASLDDKERWRVYLFFYAAALLIGVGYLVARVFAAQAALKEANESLEKRVAVRTKELSEALVQPEGIRGAARADARRCPRWARWWRAWRTRSTRRSPT